jgi:hypothetical protein
LPRFAAGLAAAEALWIHFNALGTRNVRVVVEMRRGVMGI